METTPPFITAVVVTYNRKDLLLRCVEALHRQTLKPSRILIVNNASSDGTVAALEEGGWLAHPDIELLNLTENSGGAGGFSAGVQHAVQGGADWVWVMDDDALPKPDAMRNLASRRLDPRNLYGSTAVKGVDLSWPMMPIGGRSSDAIYSSSAQPDEVKVQFIPFLGLLISAQTVRTIGAPDAGFFLAADDVDYCLRARSAGADIVLIRDSQIEHPASERSSFQLPWRKFYSLKLPPWKRYYDVRNRIFVARNHYGLALYYSTIPGSFLRLLVTLLNERNRLMQIKAFFAGMVDGMLNRKGRLHERWGLAP